MWALLGSALTVDELNDLTNLLLNRFDDLTPFFQEQLACLSPQQRLVVAELAAADRPLAVKELAGLYAQILFDFLEEELDLPAVFIDVGDGFRRKPEMVGQKFVVFPGFLVTIADTAQA